MSYTIPFGRRPGGTVACGIALAVLGFGGAWLHWHQGENAQRARGTVVRNSVYQECTPKIVFALGDQRIEIDGPRQKRCAYRIGQVVEVRYRPRHPYRGWVHQPRRPWWAAGLGAVGLLMLGLGIHEYRYHLRMWRAALAQGGEPRFGGPMPWRLRRQLARTSAAPQPPARAWPLQWEDAVLVAIPFVVEHLLEGYIDFDQAFGDLFTGRGQLPLGIALLAAAIGLLLAVALRQRSNTVGGGFRRHAWALAWPGYGTLAYLGALGCGLPLHLAPLPVMLGVALFRPLRRRPTPAWIRRLLAAPATFVCAASFAHLAQANAAAWATMKAPNTALLALAIALMALLGVVPYAYFVVGPRTLAGTPFRWLHWLLRYALFLASLMLTGSGWLT